MSDLIDRQAAIEAIHNYWISEGRKLPRKMVGEYEVLDGDYKSQLRHNKMICEVIEALPSAQPGWIPCSERLPDKEDVYLCCSTSQDIWILRYMMPYYFKEGAFIQFDGDYPVEFSDVIAWMPLPEPWKGEEK